MSTDLEERDAAGNLTPWALACDALVDDGCDCGEDEPGTCLGCRCEAAMRAERAEVARLRAEVLELRECLTAAHRDTLAAETSIPGERATARAEERERAAIRLKLTVAEARALLCDACAAGKPLRGAAHPYPPPTRGALVCLADDASLVWLLGLTVVLASRIRDPNGPRLVARVCRTCRGARVRFQDGQLRSCPDCRHPETGESTGAVIVLEERKT